jgi:cytoskeleton protein RodZ
MPKWLVLGAIAAVILIILLMSWLNNRSLQQPDESANTTTAQAPTPAAQPQPQPAAPTAANAPVVLTATAPVWLQVSDKGGSTLFSGVLQPGQSYSVPATATAPMLKTGKPEALKINVGSQVAPAVGPAATTVHVSLLPADLMKGPAAPPAPARPTKARTAAPAAPQPATTAPVTNTAE